MPTPKLPRTAARLSTSVTIRLVPDDVLNATALANPATVLTAIQNTPIGAVESFDETNSRPAAIRFEMNADAPGRVLEAYPNQVDARTLRINRVVLYSADALETFSITGGDVVQQYKPFAIIKVESVPDNVSATVPKRITVYRGCWFTSNPKGYSVVRDLKIIQDMMVTYAERDVVNV